MHNIFGSRFVGRREPAWHGLGLTFDEPLSATGAFEIAGLDYAVAKAPLSASAFGSTLALDKIAIVREPTPDDPQPRLFGLAGRDYEIVQNLDVAAILDPLTDEWPVETAGALGNGERIFATLDLGTRDISGDPISEYFLVTAGHTGGHSIRLAYTPVRVVCQNTLVLGLAEASISSTINHSRGARATLESRVALMARLRLSADSSFRVLSRLVDIPITPSRFLDVTYAAYPEPRTSAKARLAETIMSTKELDPSDLDEIYSDMQGRDLITAVETDTYYRERAGAMREGATELFERFNDEFPHFAQSGWAAYNAVTETECFRDGKSGVEASILFGSRGASMSRALKEILSA